jgi:hypothetical protein
MLTIKPQISSQTGQPAIWKEGKMWKVRCIITPTNVNSPGNANPYVQGGDALDLTTILSAMLGQALPTFDLASLVLIVSQRPAGGANNANLYEYNFAPGTTLQNGTMQVFTGAAAQTALTELAAGNYPAGVLNDTIVATCEFFMP